MGRLGSQELLIILVLVLLVFGGAKLPQLAKNLGQAQKEFRSGFSEGEEEKAKSKKRKTSDKDAGGEDTEDDDTSV